MCGILGAYNFNDDITHLLRKQTHRGPDFTGLQSFAVHGSSLQLGHNRLKIICLSDEANQPFVDERQQHFLTYNGEIYNYLELQQELEAKGIRLKNDSDTEVLLQILIHYGLDGLSKLNGMFAFAYYNHLTNKLYLVRDRFGVKPLYYYLQSDRLIFASTSSVIADTLGLKPNFTYLKKGLQYGIFEDESEKTAYQHLKMVKPGHYVEISLDKVLAPKEVCFYDFKQRVALLKNEIQLNSSLQLQDKVTHLLTQAVTRRLHSDVPMAIALSGGLDSSTIAALAQIQLPHIETFCFGDPLDLASEGKLAKTLGEKLKFKTHFAKPDKNEWKTAFWDTLEHQDAPIAGLSVVAQHLLYKKISQHGFKVVLGGQGGDEAFLGYRKFQLFYFQELVRQKQWGQSFSFLSSLFPMVWAERGRWSLFWRTRAKFQLQGKASMLQLPGSDPMLNLGAHATLGDRQIADVLQYSLPTLLRYEDRNSMAYSIESRLPFMDYHLMELACALPHHLKIKQGYGKWVIREMMENKIPNEIRLARYKKGFDVCQSQTVFHSLQKSIQSKLAEKKALLQEFLPKVDMTQYFRVEELQHEPQRFTELSVLLWLGAKL